MKMAPKSLKVSKARQPLAAVLVLHIFTALQHTCCDTTHYGSLPQTVKLFFPECERTKLGGMTRVLAERVANQIPHASKASMFADVAVAPDGSIRRQETLSRERQETLSREKVPEVIQPQATRHEVKNDIVSLNNQELFKVGDEDQHLPTAGLEARDSVVGRAVSHSFTNGSRTVDETQTATDTWKSGSLEGVSSGSSSSPRLTSLSLRTSDRYHSTVPVSLLPGYGMSIDGHYEHLQRQQHYMLERLQRIRGLSIRNAA